MNAKRAVMLAVVAVCGLMAFTWPLFITPTDEMTITSQGPFLFAVVLPIVLGLAVAEISGDGISPRALAMLGVLAALGTIARPLGAGVAGLELAFVVLIIGGRAFGPAFGFLLGNVTLFSSALITGGVGPWLPYQMLAAGFVALGAGLLPEVRGKREVLLLCGYGAVCAFAYGWLMDLAFWPFTLGPGTDASYLPGAPVLENLHRFVVYNVMTSMGWNLGRAISNVVGIALLALPMLRVLRRTTRKAQFVGAHNELALVTAEPASTATTHR